MHRLRPQRSSGQPGAEDEMPPETKQPWEARLREAAAHVETDVKRMVTYLNDEVVPDVRRNGSAALRSAAGELQHLAERMERANTLRETAQAQQQADQKTDTKR